MAGKKRKRGQALPSITLRPLVRLHNTLTKKVEAVRTVERGVVRMYVCGISTSGPPHVGHGRSYVVFDVIRRVLVDAGYEVRHVQNFTDIEESIVRRAAERGIPPLAYADEMIQAFHVAMDRLGILRPHHMPRVTEYVDKIIAATAQLIEQDCAYKIDDGVAFRACELDTFGDILGKEPGEAIVHEVAREEWGGREEPFDFVLWRNRDDLGTAWKTPWGAGRPGWHTECAVMATELLGPTIDLHGGGTDLVFPHHESERSIATCLTGEDLCKHWVHNGLVTMAREKMSKSLKNYVTLADALDERGAACVRVEYLLTPYRETLEWRKQTLDAAHRAVGVLAAGLARASDGEPTGAVALLSCEAIDALRNDLDTPRAIAALLKIADGHATDAGARPALERGLRLLGLAELPPFAEASA